LNFAPHSPDDLVHEADNGVLIAASRPGVAAGPAGCEAMPCRAGLPGWTAGKCRPPP